MQTQDERAFSLGEINAAGETLSAPGFGIDPKDITAALAAWKAGLAAQQRVANQALSAAGALRTRDELWNAEAREDLATRKINANKSATREAIAARLLVAMHYAEFGSRELTPTDPTTSAAILRTLETIAPKIRNKAMREAVVNAITTAWGALDAARARREASSGKWKHGLTLTRGPK
jgi:hypothetical protein